MPNHVTSRCTITGPAEEVVRFREMAIVTKMEERREHWPAERVAQPYTTLDFGAIIPMPDCLNPSVPGSSEASSLAEVGMAMIHARGDRGAPFATFGLYEAQIQNIRSEAGLARDASISDVAAAYLAKNPKVEAMGCARMRALIETGYANWYPWSIANWGTKWGAYQFAEISAEPLTIEFQTAWSFPTPIFEKLAEMFPTLTFDCICFDEGWNFAGVGGFGATDQPFEEVTATDELYERVYGRKPEHDDEEEAA